MSAQHHRYAMEFYNRDRRRLGQLPMETDFTPALEWTWLQGLRRGQMSPDCLVSDGVVTPVWSVELGAPYLEAVRVEHAGGRVREEFGTTYFYPFALEASAAFVKAGMLQENETFHYTVMAFERAPAPAAACGPGTRAGAVARSTEGPETRAGSAVAENPETRAGSAVTQGSEATDASATVGSEPPTRRPLSLKITHHAPRLPLHDGSLLAMRGRARAVGRVRAEDYPVFLPETLLEEVKARAREAQGKECGGILLGNLYRDPDLPEVFAEVTAQVPARHVEADAHRLTFTPQTWRAVDAALELRGSQEVMLGWWHSHPVGHWCGECSPEKRERCLLKGGFLSSHDRRLHRTVFPRAYSLALVVTEPGDEEPTCDLFGWRRERLKRRGYGLLTRPGQRRPTPIGPTEADLVGPGEPDEKEMHHGRACEIDG